jgi:bacterial/archaeal transporter family protein
MNPYILIAMVSTIMFGFATIIQKRTTGIDSVTFAMISLGASFLSVFFYWVFFAANKNMNLNGISYSLLSGVLTGFAYLFFIIALRMCKVSTVVIINSFNAVIAVLLAVVLLKEHLTVTQIAGVILGISGVILVTI